MNKDIAEYSTLAFDCDGVLLNSNRVKTDAFYQAALPYGESAAQALADYHIQHGGISRYQKFAYFLDNIVPGQEGPTLDELLECYAEQVHQALMSCEIAQGLTALREKTSQATWLIVSGGDQGELREVFKARGIAELFNGGIFGSPDNKDEILSRELGTDNIIHPALFLGDSRYDHIAASKAGLSFVFVSGWSEFSGWEAYCQENGIPRVNSISDLLDAR